MDHATKASELFLEGYNCAQAVAVTAAAESEGAVIRGDPIQRNTEKFEKRLMIVAKQSFFV